MKPFPWLAALLLGAALSAGVAAYPPGDDAGASEAPGSFLKVGEKYQFSWSNHRTATVLEIRGDGWLKVKSDTAAGPDVIEWINLEHVEFIRDVPEE